MNELSGSVPQSVSSLANLQSLFLQSNDLNSTLEFDLFLKLKNLVVLKLSHNNFSLHIKPNTNASTLPKFEILGLGYCNLNEFPDFLQNQDKLEYLELDHNNIQGQVTKWMWNVSAETLLFLNLAANFLTGFHQPPIVLPWTNLQFLELNSNKIQGPLPIPPPSILVYYVSGNNLTGEISMICNLTSLLALDLSNNKLSGLLPQCLVNLSDSLSILNLRINYFNGTIPQTCTDGSKLKMIDFSQNQLQGHIPRSLAKCTMLETLNLGNNQINDTFPSWLGILPELKILILQSNEFYGTIGKPQFNFEFLKLRIIELSYNNFIGTLLREYFQNWKAMQIVDADHLSYMQANASIELPGYFRSDNYSYSMTLTNKGISTKYNKILDFFVAVDLSSNKFQGDIPEIVGNLKGLRMLNLSNNVLSGPIPSSLENLTKLESLDLSQNKLTDKIPQQLTQLNFLETFDVFNNHLTGPIPHGKQFDTFDNSSFDGNVGLCGSPLSKKCKNLKDSPPPSSTFAENHDSKLPFEFGWKVVVVGYMDVDS